MDYVDALRGAACLWVLLHHSLEHYPVAAGWAHLPLRALVALANIGWLGVSLFLVLSGFCLYYPLARRAPLSEISLDVKAFAKRRAWRILPPYYVAMLVYIVALEWIAFEHHAPLSWALPGWKDIGAHILMLHNLMSSTLGTINAAFWSLALESQLYLIFPLLVVLAAKRGLRAILGVTFGIAVVWQTIVFFQLGFSLEWGAQMAQLYHALPGRAFEFAVGMSAAAIVARPVISAHIRRNCVIAAAILIGPAIFYVARVSTFGPLVDQMWGVLFGCALVLLHGVPAARFRDNAVLRFLTWTGVISYSLYLIHNLVFRFFPLPPAPDALLILLTLARGVAAIGVALIFFVLFEKPFLRERRKNEGLVAATVSSPAP